MVLGSSKCWAIHSVEWLSGCEDEDEDKDEGEVRVRVRGPRGGGGGVLGFSFLLGVAVASSEWHGHGGRRRGKRDSYIYCHPYVLTSSLPYGLSFPAFRPPPQPRTLTSHFALRHFANFANIHQYQFAFLSSTPLVLPDSARCPLPPHLAPEPAADRLSLAPRLANPAALLGKDYHSISHNRPDPDTDPDSDPANSLLNYHAPRLFWPPWEYAFNSHSTFIGAQTPLT